MRGTRRALYVAVLLLSSPAIAPPHVLVGADDGLLHCLDLASGDEVWSHDTNDDLLLFGVQDARIHSSPAAAGGAIVFGGSNGYLYCLGAP